MTIALTLSGNLMGAVDQGKTGLTLTNSHGRPELRYTGLVAYDASGNELPAWLELRDEQLLVKVEDQSARYPIVIDPFTQLAKLAASDLAGNDDFGGSVAIDGTTVVVAPLNVPGAYVFVKPSTGWASMTETAKLTASDGTANDRLGDSVAINGNTVVAVLLPYRLLGTLEDFLSLRDIEPCRNLRPCECGRDYLSPSTEYRSERARWYP